MGCTTEAGSLEQRQDEFRSAYPSIGFSYLMALYEDTSGKTPEGRQAEAYWETIGEPEAPVFADVNAALLDATPFTGANAAGKCLLDPQMQILGCQEGHGADDWAYEIIIEREGL